MEAGVLGLSDTRWNMHKRSAQIVVVAQSDRSQDAAQLLIILSWAKVTQKKQQACSAMFGVFILLNLSRAEISTY